MLAGWTMSGSWSKPAAERQGCSMPAPLRRSCLTPSSRSLLLKLGRSAGAHPWTVCHSAASKEGMNSATHCCTSCTPAACADRHRRLLPDDKR